MGAKACRRRCRRGMVGNCRSRMAGFPSRSSVFVRCSSSTWGTGPPLAASSQGLVTSQGKRHGLLLMTDRCPLAAGICAPLPQSGPLPPARGRVRERGSSACGPARPSNHATAGCCGSEAPRPPGIPRLTLSPSPYPLPPGERGKGPKPSPARREGTGLAGFTWAPSGIRAEIRGRDFRSCRRR